MTISIKKLSDNSARLKVIKPSEKIIESSASKSVTMTVMIIEAIIPENTEDKKISLFLKPLTSLLRIVPLLKSGVKSITASAVIKNIAISL